MLYWAGETAFKDMEVGSFGEYIHFSLFSQHCWLKVPKEAPEEFLDICSAGERAKTKKWLKSEKSKTVDRIVNIFKVEKIIMFLTYYYSCQIFFVHFCFCFFS